MWIKSSNDDKWSFRYMLIMNLTVAEFLNSWNNTLSGFNVVSSRQTLQPGISCDLNGWIGQVSVQAADFSVLAIALTTLLTVHFNSWVMTSTRYQQYLVCALVWVVPLLTGTIAVATGNIEPVSGNWCWIAREPNYLRYILGHGWRFVIFIIVIACYISIFISVRRRLDQRNKTPTLNPRYSFSMYTDSASDVNVSMVHDELVRGKSTMPTMVREAVTRNNSARNKETGLEAAQDAKHEAHERLGIKPRVRVLPSSQLDRDMRHWLLLSLFPLAYILVWIPGIANRMAELLGYQVDALTALQASTQLTGLVNSLVYGFREHRGLHRRKSVVREMKSHKSMDLDV
ncbi:hypothetical protein N0V93_008181 [Gnomoniopsis smithogilvyi]|uniref:G-protein coupled receptors family 1 profile domain-containing protein n=1 Tax=Gnomoniopsis smithogilvyi TaxID=1191159 RepID=A0A9W9CTM9_9PEZI|nr:hypothetical protein N0V93_008181 [Gnomoniopsis smithogilvyi]